MTSAHAVSRCTAFAGSRKIASGSAAHVASAVHRHIDVHGSNDPVLVFDDQTGRPVEFDLRGSAEEVAARLAQAATQPADADAQSRGRGRPKLGVVAREVTLLPRHWDWLNAQPGGASVALRKLVDSARNANAGKETARRAQEATDRFLRAVAGDLPGYEEASRALYSGDGARFAAQMDSWPADIRDHALEMAAEAFPAAE
jgi:hypothetical protein